MIISTPIDYALEGKPHQALLVRDDAKREASPTVLCFHAWDGRTSAHDEFAHRLAGLGWSAFSVDLYGKGVIGNTTEECQALMNSLIGDRARLRNLLLEIVARPRPSLKWTLRAWRRSGSALAACACSTWRGPARRCRGSSAFMGCSIRPACRQSLRSGPRSSPSTAGPIPWRRRNRWSRLARNSRATEPIGNCTASAAPCTPS